MDEIERELRWQRRHASKRISYLRNALDSIVYGNQVGDADKHIAFDALEADSKLDRIGEEHNHRHPIIERVIVRMPPDVYAQVKAIWDEVALDDAPATQRTDSAGA